MRDRSLFPWLALVALLLTASDARASEIFTQRAEIAGATAGAQFGYSLAFDGKTLAIGAPGAGAGAVYVYTGSGSTWALQAQFTPSDGVSGDRFGDAVALSGDTIVVGADYNDNRAGAAYVFTQSGTTWIQQAKLVASAPVPQTYFGITVATSVGTIVVGNPGNASGNTAGAAYVFTGSGASWSQQQVLQASDSHLGDSFGSAVAVAGNTLAITAAGFQIAGATYVFTQGAGTWTQQQELTVSDAPVGSVFGRSVAVGPGTIVVGADSKNSATINRTGAAYVFTSSGSTWSQQQDLVESDPSPCNFGFSAALSGATLVVGAYNRPAAGAAYVFANMNGLFSQQQELTSSDGASGDDFGSSVAAAGNTLVVGAANKNSATGAVYIFTGSVSAPSLGRWAPLLAMLLLLIGWGTLRKSGAVRHPA
jgi:hypothetical protein